MALIVGSRLGPYEIQSALGAGGMGEVYKARDTRLDRTVAIKILPEALASDPQFRDRFDREARTISQLDHPNICTLYDVGEQDRTAFLVMQYLEGETLEQRLKKGALPIDQVLQYAIQIADALDKAHRAGIVHRDLKPGNIMLTKSGAKLLDFGLAKTTRDVGAVAGLSMLPTTPPNLTAHGTILGTLQYMAPEQIEGQEADPRTDIFAFGCVLYEMLTGTRAFAGNTQASLIGAIMHTDPVPMTAAPPLVPRGVDRLVRTCLAKHADARWQSAHDLREALTWITDEALHPTPSGISTKVFGLRERLAWLVVAIALIAVAGLGGWVWTLRRPASRASVVRFDVITRDASDPTSFALSPDSRLLVFVALADGAPTLWLRPLDETAARPLTGTQGASYPFWSPDAHAIGFFADSKLKRIDVGGGTPQVLADAPGGRGGTWNGDDIILFTPTPSASDPLSVLMRVSATGGTPMPATHLSAGQGSHRWPQFLPDGRRFIFLSALGRPDTNGVYLGSLDGREPTRLMLAESGASFVPPDTLLVVRQGELVGVPFDPDRGTVTGEGVPVVESVGTDGATQRSLFSVSQAGGLAYRSASGSQRRQLVWLDRSGARLGTVGAPDDASLAGPSLDPANHRVAVNRAVGGNLDVWQMDATRGDPTRVTFDQAVDADPIWSADGRRLMFRSTRNGTSDLFEKPASGGVEQLLLRDAGAPLSASPDGRFLLYVRNDLRTRGDLWALPLGDDRKPFAVLQTPADENSGEFSPDGRWIAYQSNESGRFEIYVRSFPASSGPWQVSAMGGTQPRWRHDAKELYFVAPDSRLMAAAVTVSADSQTVDVAAPVPLFPARLATGSNVLPSRPQYAVGPDGRFLLNTVVDEATVSPITIVLNWPAALKK